MCLKNTMKPKIEIEYNDDEEDDDGLYDMSSNQDREKVVTGLESNERQNNKSTRATNQTCIWRPKTKR